MATIAAVIGSEKNARLGGAPFLQAMFTSPAERSGRLDEAVVDTSRIMLLGLIMDSIYQYIEFDSFHPCEAVIIMLLLAFLPSVLLRGPIPRAACPRVGPGAAKGPL